MIKNNIMKFLYSLALGLLLFSCSNEEQSELDATTDNLEFSSIDEINTDDSETHIIETTNDIEVDAKGCSYRWKNISWCGYSQMYRYQKRQRNCGSGWRSMNRYRCKTW